MKKAIWVAVLAVFLALSPAVAQVSTDYDRGVDFSAFKTWAWMEGTPALDPFAQQRIEEAIESKLAEKGLVKAQSGQADLFVVTHVSVSTEKQVDVSHMGYGGYYGWRGWGGTWGSTYVNVREIPVGTLVVDLVDAEKNELVWRGMASDTISDKPKKREKRIRRAVSKMFHRFPPKPKG
jgi:hypothetical protein